MYIVSPANMWTRPEIVAFKDEIKQAGVEGIIKVSHGESITIRVPTQDEGKAVYWEFATDGYDLAFGVLFEWVKTDETEVSIHISDSEDEELDDEYGKWFRLTWTKDWNLALSRQIQYYGTAQNDEQILCGTCFVD